MEGAVCAAWVLKCFQLISLLAICVLFTVPQQFELNLDSLPSDVGTETVVNVTARQLLCQIREPKKIIEVEYHEIPFLHMSRRDKPSKSVLIAVQCNEYKKKENHLADVTDCYCLNSFWVASTVLLALVWIIAVLYDTLTIYFYHAFSGSSSSSPAYCSLTFTVLSTFLLSAIGGMDLYFILFNWPFVYEHEDDRTIKSTFYFYKPPFLWLVAIGVCFLYAVLTLVESLIFLVLASKGRGHWKDTWTHQQSNSKLVANKDEHLSGSLTGSSGEKSWENEKNNVATSKDSRNMVHSPQSAKKATKREEQKPIQLFPSGTSISLSDEIETGSR